MDGTARLGEEVIKHESIVHTIFEVFPYRVSHTWASRFTQLTVNPSYLRF